MERFEKGNVGVATLKELAELLKVETDRWSRQVILAEVAQELAELEAALRGPEPRATAQATALKTRLKRAS